MDTRAIRGMDIRGIRLAGRILILTLRRRLGSSLESSWGVSWLGADQHPLGLC